MADAAEVAIESALINRLVALTFSPAISVALPNVAFTPPTPGANVSWLRGTFLPADSATIGVAFDAAMQHYGIFQIDVFYGQGSGELAPARMAASVLAHFRHGTTLTKDGFSVTVTRAPYRGRMIKDDPWVMIAVSIPYLAYANPT